MLEQDVRYLKYKTYLSFYCPHCKNTFNHDSKNEKSLIFIGIYDRKEIELKLSPFLDVFDTKASVRLKKGVVLDDLLCPKCRRSLVNRQVNCGDCDTMVGEVIVSAYAKLIPFYLCLQFGCEWHGIPKEDEKKIATPSGRYDYANGKRKIAVATTE